VVFPDDEGNHGDRLEWWYYNGHLLGDDDSEWGFHFVIFQARQPGLPTAYVGQLGLTDVGSGGHVEGSTFFLQADAGEGGNLILRGGQWELVIDESGHRLTGHVGDASLTLLLEPQRPPALHNEIGWLSGPTGWTYYYSWTRMAAVGSIRTGAEDVQVTGTAWMDHQWGDFIVPPYPAGWQWFAIQMDDGPDLMLTLNRDGDGVEADIWGTSIDAEGNRLALTEEDHGVSIEKLATWTSPNTGGEYPAGWRIVIDSLDLDIELWPLVADQEIPATALTPIVYWEGKVRVTGTRAGRPVSAQAYVELTGYAEPDVPAIDFASP
jgi:predicted secreted hydrolase